MSVTEKKTVTAENHPVCMGYCYSCLHYNYIYNCHHDDILPAFVYLQIYIPPNFTQDPPQSNFPQAPNKQIITATTPPFTALLLPADSEATQGAVVPEPGPETELIAQDAGILTLIKKYFSLQFPVKVNHRRGPSGSPWNTCAMA